MILLRQILSKVYNDVQHPLEDYKKTYKLTNK
jgi:hypothetical protein